MAYDLRCAWRSNRASVGKELKELLEQGWEPFQVDPPDGDGDRLVWLRARDPVPAPRATPPLPPGEAPLPPVPHR